MITIPGRIPIRIHTFFWLLIFMIGWINSNSIQGTLIWGIVILVSVLFHEFGHALTARLFGQEAEISLVGIGGQTKRQGDPLSKWKEFMIVLNGPLAGLFLFYMLYKLEPSFPPAKYPVINYALEIGVEVNLFWTVLNLLPVWSMDGGHLMRILLEGAFGFRGFKIALWVSMILAVLFGIFFFMAQQILIGAVFLMLGFESYRAWGDVKHLTPQDNDDELRGMMKEASQLAKHGYIEEAISRFEAIRKETGKGALFVLATQYLARLNVDQGNLQGAYDLLQPLKKQIAQPDLIFLQQLAYKLQKWDETIKIGTEIYQENHLPDVALLNALSCAILGKGEPAVGWLRSAVESGLKDPGKVIQMREFDAIHETPQFQSWINILIK